MPPLPLKTFPLLYFVATPLGNLSDFSLRAIEQLKRVDYILCEDTRSSKTLLDHYDIKKPLKSFHKFNENYALETILSDLRAGKEIALISDAGTPGICDPGRDLVVACHKENLPLTALPGPCALILALSLSGFNSEKFQFIGFLPKATNELKKTLAEALSYSGTTICYESPHRLLETLSLLPVQKKVCVVREMTKIYEECVQASAQEVLDYFQNKQIRGEIVLILEGSKKDYATLSSKEHVAFLQEEYGLSLQDAIKLAASLRDLPKREVYRDIHDL